ncbi:MAG: phosphonate ABC transporter ATP-binding protein [Acidobacteria bacterium]|jgi:phosphonate transport system ATP-binding protein|nr:MAG: phosphonate ABC transporter ATP-binding protein [Acidobacteriota bacterium]
MVKFVEVSKNFGRKPVLSGVSLEVREGEMIALIGPSGSGKTTLIRMVNGFVVPDSGEVWVMNRKVEYRSRSALKSIRKETAMVYQLFNLVDRLTTLQNVLSGALGRYNSLMETLLSCMGFFKREDVELAMDILRYVGLEEKAYERVDRLSGGQKQRVAIARALMQQPRVLLADEPIASLDPKTGKKIINLLRRINQEKGIAVICVLHHIDMVREYFERVVAIREGRVLFDGRATDLDEGLLEEIYQLEEEACTA